MNAITKATCKRLNRHKGDPCIQVIGQTLFENELLYYCKNRRSGKYTYSAPDDFLTQCCGFRWSGDHAVCTVDSEYKKKYFRGLASRYPDFIECTFTHGLNQMSFKKDMNEFIRLIVHDIESGR